MRIFTTKTGNKGEDELSDPGCTIKIILQLNFLHKKIDNTSRGLKYTYVILYLKISERKTETDCRIKRETLLILLFHSQNDCNKNYPLRLTFIVTHAFLMLTNGKVKTNQLNKQLLLFI